MTGTRGLPLVIVVAFVAVLAGCGPMPESTPTTTVQTTPPMEETAATPGTSAAAELTLGELAERVNAAWPTVRSYRITFTGATVIAPAALGTPVARPPATPGATPAATPGATPVARSRENFVIVREVVLPDRQRQEVTGLGADDHEAIAIGDQLFVRGPLAEQIVPGTPPGVWIAIDLSTLPDDATLTQRLGGLPQLPAAPLASLPERLTPQLVRDIGDVEQDRRVCRVYGAADTVSTTGMRVDYSIAVDDRDIPCFIETSAGGIIQGRSEYRGIDAAFTIAAPSAATPVSVPPALATPVVRD